MAPNCPAVSLNIDVVPAAAINTRVHCRLNAIEMWPERELEFNAKLRHCADIRFRQKKGSTSGRMSERMRKQNQYAVLDLHQEFGRSS